LLKQLYKALTAGFGLMTETGGRACAFVLKALGYKDETGCFVMKTHRDSARLPVVVRMRNHRKAFKRFIVFTLLLVLLPATSFAITPPGTVINNVASAAFNVGSTASSATSNTATVTSTIISTPSIITLYQFAPGGAGSLNVDVPTSHASSGPPGTGFIVSPNPTIPVAGAAPSVIDPNISIGLNVVEALHTGEPIFIHVDDKDQNLNPAVRETINVVVTSPTTGDEEEIILIETGVDTGEFIGYVQSTSAAVSTYNGVLTLGSETEVVVNYVDKFDGSDSSAATELVDPFGILFDSVDGSTLDGVTVSIVDSLGNPANVFADDGVSTYPNVLVTGQSFVNNGPGGDMLTYNFPPGGYRFPLLAPGDYQIVVTSPSANLVVPSLETIANLQTIPGAPYALDVNASFGNVFTLVAGPALHADIPFDKFVSSLVLTKEASTTSASVGDFVQYTLKLDNVSVTGSSLSTTINDVLPSGFRYQTGSVQAVDNTATVVAIPDPVISPDGKTLAFSVGDLLPSSSLTLKYITEVSSSTPVGKAVNTANAIDIDGTTSNTAQASIRIIEELFSSVSFIAGRVIVGECDADAAELPGMQNVRIYMENGTYVVTDEIGQFHFEGVVPGSHIVQVDKASVPPNLEVIDCEDDTRSAGSPTSRFVELQGGSLWRTNFYVREKAPITDSASVYMESVYLAKETKEGNEIVVTDKGKEETVKYTIKLANGKVPVSNYKLIVSLPEGVTYIPETSFVDSILSADPSVNDNVLVYRFNDLADNWERTVTFNATVKLNADGELVTKALMLADTELKRNLRTEPVTNTLKVTRERRETKEFVYTAYFTRLGVELTDESKRKLTDLVLGYEDADISINHIIGHTSTMTIKEENKKYFHNNKALGLERARVVSTFMQDELNIASESIVMESRAGTEPIASNKTEAGRAKNRRAELFIQSSQIVGKGAVEVIVPKSTVSQVELRGQPVYDFSDDYNPAPMIEPKAIGMFDEFWIEKAEPGLEWLMPEVGHYMNASFVNIAIKHAPTDKFELLHNDQPVSGLFYFGKIKNKANTVARSYWQGIHTVVGENKFEFIVRDKDGVEIDRIVNEMNYSGTAIQAELSEHYSRLIADGSKSPVIAIQLKDADGKYARPGTIGRFHVSPPYMSMQEVEALDEKRLTGLDGKESEFVIGREGIALIKLEPTTVTGKVIVNLELNGGVAQEVEAWLHPELRDWVMVGLAEGTLGMKDLSGNIQALNENEHEDGFYQDGKLAFFAKGKVSGDFLLTAALDSSKASLEKQHRVNQLIQPGTYYTIYGDGSEQKNNASSSDKLYLKIERDQFYALYGDFDTDLNVTELSKYNRSFTGIRSEMELGPVSYSAFAAENIHNYGKDEIRGDGTSGIYQLSAKDLVINSEKIVIETRDRFRSEIIIETRTLDRHIDYSIDYVDGSLIFREPIASNDSGFNPIFIVAEYEVDAAVKGGITTGGRVAIKLMDDKVELGGSVIHDATKNAESNLIGADLNVKLDDKTTLRAEAATSTTSTPTGDVDGSAVIVEVEHATDKIKGKAYLRQQDSGFGVGQQSTSQSGTRKLGVEGQYSISEQVVIDATVYHEDLLTTDSKRDVVDANVKLSQDGYALTAGARMARDRDSLNNAQDSDLLLLGASGGVFDNDLELRANAEIGVGSSKDNPDYPSRFIVGGDYKLTDNTGLYAENEWTMGSAQDTQMSRAGVRSSPWQGANVNTSFNRQIQENGVRTFSNLGLTQGFRISERWTGDVALDQTNTIRTPGATPFNPNVAIAQGSTDDFTALSVGATYQGEMFTLANRVEARAADSEDKLGLTVNWERKLINGIGYAVSTRLYDADRTNGTKLLDGNARFSIGYRPLDSKWIVLNRLEYQIRNEIDLLFASSRERKLINNAVANYKPSYENQLSLNYGIKYALNNFSGTEYSGITHLIGGEYRHDINSQFDFGMHAHTLYSTNSSNYKYSLGVSAGWSMAKNVWLSFGYNFDGFEDDDFSAAGYTAAGPYIRFRLKFDSDSIKQFDSWRKE